MVDDDSRARAEAAMRRINQTWIEGRVDDLAALVHPDVVVAVPGFVAHVGGRARFLEGFREFCTTATIHHFREYDHQTDVIDDTAVVTFRYEMDYERADGRYRATGRDLWVFARQAREWVAVWRAMLEIDEQPA
jgi:hypothetical protein